MSFTDGAGPLWQCGREVGHQMYGSFCFISTPNASECFCVLKDCFIVQLFSGSYELKDWFPYYRQHCRNKTQVHYRILGTSLQWRLMRGNISNFICI